MELYLRLRELPTAFCTLLLQHDFDCVNLTLQLPLHITESNNTVFESVHFMLQLLSASIVLVTLFHAVMHVLHVRTFVIVWLQTLFLLFNHLLLHTEQHRPRLLCVFVYTIQGNAGNVVFSDGGQMCSDGSQVFDIHSVTEVAEFVVLFVQIRQIVARLVNAIGLCCYGCRGHYGGINVRNGWQQSRR